MLRRSGIKSHSALYLQHLSNDEMLRHMLVSISSISLYVLLLLFVFVVEMLLQTIKVRAGIGPSMARHMDMSREASAQRAPIIHMGV